MTRSMIFLALAALAGPVSSLDVKADEVSFNPCKLPEICVPVKPETALKYRWQPITNIRTVVLYQGLNYDLKYNTREPVVVTRDTMGRTRFDSIQEHRESGKVNLEYRADFEERITLESEMNGSILKLYIRRRAKPDSYTSHFKDGKPLQKAVKSKWLEPQPFEYILGMSPIHAPLSKNHADAKPEYPDSLPTLKDTYWKNFWRKGEFPTGISEREGEDVLEKMIRTFLAPGSEEIEKPVIWMNLEHQRLFITDDKQVLLQFDREPIPGVVLRPDRRFTNSLAVEMQSFLNYLETLYKPGRDEENLLREDVYYSTFGEMERCARTIIELANQGRTDLDDQIKAEFHILYFTRYQVVDRQIAALRKTDVGPIIDGASEHVDIANGKYQLATDQIPGSKILSRIGQRVRTSMTDILSRMEVAKVYDSDPNKTPEEQADEQVAAEARFSFNNKEIPHAPIFSRQRLVELKKLVEGMKETATTMDERRAVGDGDARLLDMGDDLLEKYRTEFVKSASDMNMLNVSKPMFMQIDNAMRVIAAMRGEEDWSSQFEPQAGQQQPQPERPKFIISP